MMNSIVEEKRISFKTLEQKVFAYICELGREITRVMLESYDEELARKFDSFIFQKTLQALQSLLFLFYRKFLLPEES